MGIGSLGLFNKLRSKAKTSGPQKETTLDVSTKEKKGSRAPRKRTAHKKRSAGLATPSTFKRKEAKRSGGKGLNEPQLGAPTDVVKNGRNGASTGAISGKHASKRETNIGAVAQIVRVRKSQDYMDYRSAAEQLADLAAESKTQRDPNSFLMSNLTAMCEKLSPSDRKALAGGSVVGIPGYGSNDPIWGQ